MTLSVGAFMARAHAWHVVATQRWGADERAWQFNHHSNLDKEFTLVIYNV
jgi:hypothetical protein